MKKKRKESVPEKSFLQKYRESTINSTHVDLLYGTRHQWFFMLAKLELEEFMDVLIYQLGRKRKYKHKAGEQLYTHLLITFLEALPRIAQGKLLEIRREDKCYHLQYGNKRRISIERSQLSRPYYEILDRFIRLHPVKGQTGAESVFGTTQNPSLY